MLDRLRTAGIGKVIAVDLTRETLGVPVLRVIVPGLAGLLEDDADDPALQRRVRRAGSRMNACIFAGPTLPPRDPARSLERSWMPPARHGDVYRAVVTLRPRAIGIVDGFFQWAPAVWHKEILWAIHRGVHVFGAASMGALRAAELSSFGMRGVGAIFEAYRDGTYSPHAARRHSKTTTKLRSCTGRRRAATSQPPKPWSTSDCTLTRAEREGVIDAAARARLVSIGKELFFPTARTRRFCERGRKTGLLPEVADRLEAWLPAGRVDQKRLDAVAMLDALAAFLAGDPAPAHPDFVFEHTLAWDKAVQALRARAQHSTEDLLVLTELRLEDTRFLAWRREALDALTATRDAEAPGQASDEPPAPVLVERHVLSRSRAVAVYGPLLARARSKQACLARLTGLPRATDFPEWKLLDLRDWFFSKVREWEMPDDLDGYLAELGYEDETAFHEALLAEFVYRRDGG